MKNVTVRATIRFLIDLVDKGEIHLDDKIAIATVLQKETEVEDIYINGGQLSGTTVLPEETLNLLIWSNDPDATDDTNVYIFPKDKKEEAQE